MSSIAKYLLRYFLLAQPQLLTSALALPSLASLPERLDLSQSDFPRQNLSSGIVRDDIPETGLSIIYELHHDKPEDYEIIETIINRVWEKANRHQAEQGPSARVGGEWIYHWEGIFTTTGLSIDPKPELTWKLWADALEKMERFVRTSKLGATFSFALFMEGARDSIGSGAVWTKKNW